MSEELLQRGLNKDNPTAKVGKWDYYSIGATTVKALKAANIIYPKDYGDVDNKKVDGLLVSKKQVIAVVEFKQPKEFKTSAQKQKAILQELEVARRLGAKILVATDHQDAIWVNVLTGDTIIAENGTPIGTLFKTEDEHLPALIDKINYSINETNNQILAPNLVDPTGLARSIWQDIWSVSGATPENCLYTFVELFIFKYLSDLNILRTHHSFSFLYNMYKDNSDDEVLEYYAENVRKKIKELFPYNPKDNTTIINGTIFVSKDQKAVDGYSAVFRKVLQRFNDYGSVAHIDYDFKSKLFESFLKESISKKNWGQFFTPMKVVRAIEKMAKDEIKEGAVIGDPACGVGKFLLEPIKSRLDRFFSIENGKLKSKITLKGFDKGFDKDEQKTIILAKANMLIYFSEIIKKYPECTHEFSKLFNDTFTLKTNSILGTLSEPVENEYDLILTNPPYVTSGSSNLKDEIQKDDELKNYYKINAIGVEGLFMEWIVRALKPNGKAFIVVPDGIFNRQNDKNLRAFLRKECFIDAIISLPLNTFFTTNKKTYLLCLTKKNNNTDIQIDPVFTYLVSEIGESRDVYRFDIEQNDLEEAVTRYGLFKGNKQAYAKVMNDDLRCKIVQIDQFSPEAHWSVDRLWSQEEKVSLGIEEEGNSIDILEFSTVVADMADTLGGIGSMLKEISQKKTLNNLRKEISLADKCHFQFITTKTGWTKTQYTKFDTGNEKDIPLYTAAKAPVAFVKSVHQGIIDASDKCPVISFAANGDGSAGTNLVLHTSPFYISNDRSCFRVINKSIDTECIFAMLHGMKEKYGFNHAFKATKNNIGIVTLAVPVTKGNEFDLEAQKNIVEKFNLIIDLKEQVFDYRKIINNTNIIIDTKSEYNFKEFRISEIFETKKGVSKYTKTYGKQNHGEYPVYSASNKAPLTHICHYDYDGRYLTWATNGFAGYMWLLSGKFSLNGDRGLLLPKRNDLDISYIKFTLEPLLRDLAKGRKGDNGEDEFTKVYASMVEAVSIPIPVLPTGELDLEAQKEIAEQYQKIDETKALVLAEFTKIRETSLVL